MTFRYRRLILDELATHGVQPTPDTRPEVVHEFVNDLYRHELRRLRTQLRSGDIPSVGYADRVRLLRKKYFLLSIRLELWTVPAETIRRL